MDPNTGNPVEFIIPYVSPKAYWNVDDADDEGYFGKFVLRVLNPLRMTNATATPAVTISIFANFENVELAGPTLHAQMKENRGKAEQKTKSEQGLISSGLSALGGVASVVKRIPFLPPQVSLGAGLVEGALNGASKFAALFGFNKPTSVASFQPVYLSTTNSLANGSGLNVLNDLSLVPENAVGNQPSEYGREFSEHSLKHIAQKPGLLDSWTFNATNTTGEIVRKYRVTPMSCPTYNINTTTSYTSIHIPCSLVGYMFKYWRGSMKYYIQITCSKTTTGRIRISYVPTYGEIPTNFTDGEGDFISTVVDFNGPTALRLSVPYLSDKLYKECEDTWIKTEAGNSGALAFSIVNPVISMDTTLDSTVYVNVFCAAGEDMDFQFLRERGCATGKTRKIVDTGIIPGLITWIGQGSSETTMLEDIFASDFPPMIPSIGLSMQKVTSGETITDFLTILHRFQLWTSTTLVHSAWTQMNVESMDDRDSTFNILNRYYLFHKGSYCWKIVRANSNNAEIGTLFCVFGEPNVGPDTLTAEFGRNGTVFEDFAFKPSLEWRTPFVSDYAFQPGFPTFAADVAKFTNYVKWESIGGATDLGCHIFFSVGDDFSFAWACGCPLIGLYDS
jgi:hypothetical protein